MKLTPLDIQQQQFRRELRGHDRREVQAFLDLVAQEVAEVTRENSELKAELRRSQRGLEEHVDRETTLKEAMLTAQRAIEEIREQAQKEAQLVVSEAELRAERIVHAAHSKATRILEDVNDLRRQRARAISELRGIVATHNKLLDVHEHSADAESREATVTVLERLRAPAPPTSEDFEQLEIIG